MKKLSSGPAWSASVMHWNILAKSLGKNCKPWFLHGIQLSPARRGRIFQNYYARDPDTHALLNEGWPAYAKSVLTPDEMRKIELVDTMNFEWEARFEKIMKRIIQQNADVVSLVELDAFEDSEKRLRPHGYEGAFAVRPRSNDGNALFWKKSEFELVAERDLVFEDRIFQNDTSAKVVKDRSALAVVLESKKPAAQRQRFLFASTHLARDAHDQARDTVRATQLAQLAVHLRRFATESGASLDAPVVLCGDVNATSLAKLKGMVAVGALLQDGGEPLYDTVTGARLHRETPFHQFVFSSEAVNTRGTTSKTESRNARLDAIIYSADSLDAENRQPDDIGTSRVIPDEAMPSDHYPILAHIGFKPNELRSVDSVRRWWLTALTSPDSDLNLKLACSPASMATAFTFNHGSGTETPQWATASQMGSQELGLAFRMLDRDGDGFVSKEDALRSLEALGLSAGFSQARLAVVAQSVANMDFCDFAARYYLAHPVCEISSRAVFDHIDESPRDGLVSVQELTQYFVHFRHSPLECDVARLLKDAKERGLIPETVGESNEEVEDDVEAQLDREQFRFLLGARFVEMAFPVDQAESIIERMKYWRGVLFERRREAAEELQAASVMPPSQKKTVLASL